VIIVVMVIVVILVAIGVTLFAQKKKILCFKKSSEGDEPGGDSPLLKDSKLSPSRATSASATTLSKSHPTASRATSGN